MDERALVFTIPAPIRGWNMRDPLPNMAPEYAPILDNVFPDSGKCTLRNGCVVHCDDLAGAGTVQTMFRFTTAAGVQYLIAAQNNNLYSVGSGSATSIKGGLTITNNKWQTTQFKDEVFGCNGVDPEWRWTGSGNAVASGWTGITAGKAAHVCTYRTRLYATEVNSKNVWYGPTDAYAGAFTSYPLSGYLSRGGYIMYCESSTKAQSTTDQSLFVVMSSEGEALVFTGSSPSDASWALVGRYFLAPPLGRRSYFHIGPNLYFFTTRGVVSFGALMSNTLDGGAYPTISEAVDPALTASAAAYGATYGWEAVVHELGKMLVVNVPTSATSAYQAVMNTSTGAWCRFTGFNATCWSSYSNGIFFAGSDGNIYQADTGNSDNGVAIPYDIQHAYNALGDLSKTKQVGQVQVVVKAPIEMAFAPIFHSDFDESGDIPTLSYTGDGAAQWNTAEWDTASWGGASSYLGKKWYPTRGVGRLVSLRMKGTVLDSTFEILASNITYKLGGIFL